MGRLGTAAFVRVSVEGEIIITSPSIVESSHLNVLLGDKTNDVSKNRLEIAHIWCERCKETEERMIFPHVFALLLNPQTRARTHARTHTHVMDGWRGRAQYNSQQEKKKRRIYIHDEIRLARRHSQIYSPCYFLRTPQDRGGASDICRYAECVYEK